MSKREVNTLYVFGAQFQTGKGRVQFDLVADGGYNLFQICAPTADHADCGLYANTNREFFRVFRNPQATLLSNPLKKSRIEAAIEGDISHSFFLVERLTAEQAVELYARFTNQSRTSLNEMAELVAELGHGIDQATHAALTAKDRMIEETVGKLKDHIYPHGGGCDENHFREIIGKLISESKLLL